jgi:hypothetical protein
VKLDWLLRAGCGRQSRALKEKLNAAVEEASRMTRAAAYTPAGINGNGPAQCLLALD